MFDPLFYKTTKKFDDLSMGKLLGSTLNINSKVLLKMDSSDIDFDKQKDRESEENPNIK